MNINYSFYVDTTSTNPSTTTQKLIIVKVIKSEASTSTKAAIISTQSLMGIGIAFIVFLAIVTKSQPILLWDILQQLQMVIFLLMIDSYAPIDIIKFLEGIDFVMFSFNFLPIYLLPLYFFTDWMKADKPFEKLKLIGMDSRSTTINLIPLLTVILLIVLIHLILLMAALCLSSNTNNKVVKFISWLRLKLIDFILYFLTQNIAHCL